MHGFMKIFMDNRGALTIDLIFSIFILLIVLSSISSLISDRMSTAGDLQELAEGRSLADTIAGDINQVYAGGEGHQLRITTPPSIRDQSYEIFIDSSGVYIEFSGRKGLSHIIPDKISSSSSLNQSTATLLPDRDYLIRNVLDRHGQNWIVIMEDK